MTKHHDLSLANRALLVSLSISDWTARKFDRAASREVTQNHGASDRAARVNKNLLPGAVYRPQA